MRNLLFAMLTISVGLFSCSEEEEENINNNSNNQPSEFYIEGRVDGIMMRGEHFCPYNGCEESASNYNEWMEAITMQRMITTTSDSGWSINLWDVDLDNWQLPDTINAYDPDGIDLDVSFYIGTWESDNNYTSDEVVLGPNSFQMIVTSKTGDVLEGTFSGELRNGSDTEDRKTVTEGRFKIFLHRI